MDWMCIPCPHSYVENLIPKVMMLGSELFGRWLGDESETLISGISVL